MASWIDRVRRRLTEEEYVEELHSHLAHEIDEQIDRHVPPDEARSAALRKLGNVTVHLERFREASPVFWLEILWQDVRQGWRSLWHAPLVSLVAIASLALGIGANTAVYTIARAVLLKPLQLPDAERMFVIRDRDSSLGFIPPLRPNEFEDVLRIVSEFGSAGNWTEWAAPMRSGNGVTMGWFLFASERAVQAFGTQPKLGRWPTPDEYESGAPVMVLTDAGWRLFGRDPDVLGQRISVRGRPNSDTPNGQFTVVGVAPPSLHSRLVGMPYTALMPLRSLEVLSRGSVSKAAVINGGILGRLAPGRSMQQAEQRVASWQLGSWGPRAVPRRLQLLPAADASVSDEQRDRVGRAVDWLAVLAGIVLLLGCGNLAAVMLARSDARRPELGMRITLGATRFRLMRMLTVEYALLALVSAGVAIAISQIMVRAFPAALALGRKWLVIPIEVPLDLTASVAAFAAVIALICCALFGLAPALRLTRLDPMVAVRGGGQARHTGSYGFLRVLLGSHIAASSLLLVGAVLLGLAVWHGTSLDLGYRNSKRLMYARVQLRGDDKSIASMRRAITERVAQHPAFVSAAFTNSTEPFASLGIGDRVVVDGIERAPASRELARNTIGGRVLVEHVDASHRRTVGLSLLLGRDLQPVDGASSEPGALVNEVLARQFWPDGQAIGRQIRVHGLNGAWQPENGTARIVGVVDNVRYDVRSGTAPCVYLLNDGVHTNGLYVRLRDDAPDGSQWLRQLLHELQPDDPPPFVLSIADYVKEELAAERVLLKIFAWFASIAVVLSLLGIYGLTSNAVTRRTREIAIRVALGAPRRLVVLLVSRATLTPTVFGIVAGLGVAAMCALTASRFVFGLVPLQLGAYSATALVMGLVVCLGVWSPTIRALRMSPTDALRAE